MIVQGERNRGGGENWRNPCPHLVPCGLSFIVTKFDKNTYPVVSATFLFFSAFNNFFYLVDFNERQFSSLMIISLSLGIKEAPRVKEGAAPLLITCYKDIGKTVSSVPS